MSDETEKMQELKTLKELEAVISRLGEKKRDLEGDLRHLRGKASNTRQVISENVDRLTENRRLLGDRRDTLRTKMDELQDLRSKRQQRIRELRQVSSSLSEMDHPGPPSEDLERKIRELEERYETQSMDREEEKRIMSRIRQLRGELTVFREWRQRVGRKEKMKDQLDELAPRIGELEEEVSEVREVVRSTQEEHDSLMRTSTRLQEDLNTTEKEYRELRTAKDAIDQQYAEAKRKKKDLLRSLNIEEPSLEPRQVKSIIEDRESRAKSASDKLRQKKKLTIEEFRALVEKGLL